MTDTNRPLRVFLCHASGGIPAVKKIYERLMEDGIDAWLDKEKLIPGQDWQSEIQKAVKNSDVVVVCLSSQSLTEEGSVQKEIKFALDKADEKPDGTIFIIPARLENCEIPERLGKFHWVDLFSEDGYERLMKALQVRAANLGISVKPQEKSSKGTNKLEFPIQVNPDLNPEFITFPSISVVENIDEDGSNRWQRGPLGMLDTGDTNSGIGIIELFLVSSPSAIYDPPIDVVVMNMTERPLVVTDLGIEIIGLSSGGGAGGGVIDHPVSLRIEMQGAYELDMPDIFSEFAHLIDDSGEYEVLNLNRVISTRLPDPIYMQPQSVFRYVLTLKNFGENMPNRSFIRLWIRTSGGNAESRILYMFTPRYPFPQDA
jgi:hypothetical protein